MNEHDEQQIELSEAGRARRGAMLGELGGEMDRVRVGRVRRKRAVVGVCVVGVAAVGVWIGVRGNPPAQQIVGLAQPVERPVVEDAPEVVASMVERIAGLPTLEVVREFSGVVRVVRAGDAAGIERVGDSMLLAELNRMGRPTGMIRRGGAVYLTASVAREPGEQTEDDGPDA